METRHVKHMDESCYPKEYVITQTLCPAFHRQGSEGVINVLDGLLLYQDIINQRWETELIEWIEECVRLGLSGQLAGKYICIYMYI